MSSAHSSAWINMSSSWCRSCHSALASTDRLTFLLFCLRKLNGARINLPSVCFTGFLLSVTKEYRANETSTHCLELPDGNLTELHRKNQLRQRNIIKSWSRGKVSLAWESFHQLKAVLINVLATVSLDMLPKMKCQRHNKSIKIAVKNLN